MLARLLAALTRQLGRPSGRLGAVLLPVLDRANGRLNQAAVNSAAIIGGEEALDVGFGGGVGLRLLARQGAVPVGADPSADVVERARRALPATELVVAGVDALPFADGRFAAVISVNTVYFWPDVATGVAELRRVLADEGRLVLGVEEAGRLAAGPLTRDFVNTDAEALRTQLEAAGFAATHVQPAGRGLLVIGTKGDPPHPSDVTVTG